MTAISLFSGIEGLGLGLKRAGWPAASVFAENAEYPNAVLKRHYPDADFYDDVAKVPTLTGVVLVHGGFPCQPVSQAGLKLAQGDARWLWPLMADVIFRCQPQYVVAENVGGLRRRGLYDVLVDLERMGYDAEWDLIPAGAVGAPHVRERFAIVAWRRDQTVGLVFTGAPVVSHWWADNDEVLPRLRPSVADRIPRLTALGNAVVPQWAEHVGRSLRAAIGREHHSAWGVPLERWAPAESEADVIVVASLFGDEERLELHAETPELPAHGRLTNNRVEELPRSFQTKQLAGRRLWPTPVTTDATGSRRATAKTDEWGSNDGTTLTDAAWIEEGVDHTAMHGTNGATGALLLPTPTAGDSHATRNRTGDAEGWERGDRHGGTTLTDFAWEDGGRLLPTPNARDHKDTGDLTKVPANGLLPRVVHRQELAAREAALWPTPHGMSGGGADGSYDGHGSELSMAARVTEGVSDTDRSRPRVWPTPKVTADRSSRRAMVENRQWAAPTLAQAVELDAGVLPREFDSEDEMNSTARSYWPTPKASPSGPDYARPDRPESGGDDLATAAAREGAAPAPLNPDWVEWLMGFPAGWTLREDTE